MLELCPTRKTTANIMLPQFGLFSLLSVCKEKWETADETDIAKVSQTKQHTYLHIQKLIHCCVSVLSLAVPV